MLENPQTFEENVELLKRILDMCNPHIQSAQEYDEDDEMPSINPRVHLSALWYSPRLWNEWMKTPMYQQAIGSYIQDIRVENMISAEFIQAGWFAWTMWVPKAMMVSNATLYLNTKEASAREARKELRDIWEIDKQLKKLLSETSMKKIIDMTPTESLITNP